MNAQKILVVGDAGYIGTHMVKDLLQLGAIIASAWDWHQGEAQLKGKA